MKTEKNKLILKKDDYNLLQRYVYTRMTPLSAENKNAEQLYEEMKMAEVFEREEELPADVVRVNSRVEVEEQGSKRLLKFRIVLPAQANLKKQQLSLFAPLSIALIGYRKGQEVSWNMPSGEKQFFIRKVTNEVIPE